MPETNSATDAPPASGTTPADKTPAESPPPDTGDGKAPETPPAWHADVDKKFIRATPEETLKAISQSYREAQAKIGGGKADKPATPAPGADAPEADATLKLAAPPPPGAEPEDFTGIITGAGLKQEEIKAQLLKDGKLTDEQIDAIHKKYGFPKKLIAQTAQADLVAYRARETEMKAQAAQTRAEAIKIAGGEQQLGTLLTWATSKIPPDQHAEINAALADTKKALPTIKALLFDYNQEVSGAKPLVQQSVAAGGDSATPFGDSTLMWEAIWEADKVHGKGNWYKDDALRQRVEASPRQWRTTPPPRKR
jgi:hypothetical protein